MHTFNQLFLRIFLFGAFLSVVCIDSFSQSVTLNDPAGKFAITHPAVFLDNSRTMTVDDVASRASAGNPERITALGPVKAAAWLKFTITNNSSRTDWVIEIQAPILEKVNLYQQQAGGRFEETKINVRNDFSTRPVRTNTILFPVTIPSNSSQVFLVRATSNNIIRLPLQVSGLQNIYETNHRKDFINGLFYGIMFCLMLYNLFVFFSLRDITYFFYVGYIFFWGLNLLFVNGYFLDFFPWASQFNSANIFISFTAIFSTLFTTSFLQTKQYAPLAWRLRWPMIILFTMPVILLLAGREFTGYTWAQWSIYPFFIYWLYAGITAYKKGLKPALYFIAGYGLLSAGATIYNLKDIGILPENAFTDDVLSLGSALEAMILSFALARKLQLYKKTNEQMQAAALEQSENFSKTLLQAQENERKRIASELHDSVGQKLILIKNKVLLIQTEESLKNKSFVQSLPQTVAETIEEVRLISYGLRPYQIDLLGLTQSLRSLVTEAFDTLNLVYTLHIDNIDHLVARENEINIYRIIQECLNNIIKHAAATHCTIMIKAGAGISISIEDNGIGIKADAGKTKGLGLWSIQERVQLAGGVLQIKNAVPHGLLIEISIPTQA